MPRRLSSSPESACKASLIGSRSNTSARMANTCSRLRLVRSRKNESSLILCFVVRNEERRFCCHRVRSSSTSRRTAASTGIIGDDEPLLLPGDAQERQAALVADLEAFVLETAHEAVHGELGRARGHRASHAPAHDERRPGVEQRVGQLSGDAVGNCPERADGILRNRGVGEQRNDVGREPRVEFGASRAGRLMSPRCPTGPSPSLRGGDAEAQTRPGTTRPTMRQERPFRSTREGCRAAGPQSRAPGRPARAASASATG